jgi:hypothetical protein
MTMASNLVQFAVVLARSMLIEVSNEAKSANRVQFSLPYAVDGQTLILLLYRVSSTKPQRTKCPRRPKTKIEVLRP